VRPVMYGYAHITDGTTQNDSIARIRHELTTYADQEGFALGEVFTETAASADPAFACMVDALRRNEVKDIIVPSLWHFASLPGLQDAMRLHVERETGARIWVVQRARS
jgi:hypothetical protein